MANSKYEYVKGYERSDALLPDCYLVIRIDGKGFHIFTDKHEYSRPNDLRGLQLMNRCAKAIMDEWSDVILAYGESDEYSFLLKRSSTLYNRREVYDTFFVIIHLTFFLYDISFLFSQ